jgi:molybdopterin-guanine dinucleotide biosynthesis protein A
MMSAMKDELEALEEQAEKLKHAVKALTSFSRPPQQRLDTALSYFVRTFRDPPEGEAATPYAAIYAAIGNPPVGTTLAVAYDTLTADDLESVATAIVDLCDMITRQCADARHVLANTAPTPVAESIIAEGKLESLEPSRGAER